MLLVGVADAKATRSACSKRGTWRGAPGARSRFVVAAVVGVWACRYCWCRCGLCMGEGVMASATPYAVPRPSQIVKTGKRQDTCTDASERKKRRDTSRRLSCGRVLVAVAVVRLPFRRLSGASLFHADSAQRMTNGESFVRDGTPQKWQPICTTFDRGTYQNGDEHNAHIQRDSSTPRRTVRVMTTKVRP